jgi:hypothetical protein
LHKTSVPSGSERQETTAKAVKTAFHLLNNFDLPPGSNKSVPQVVIDIFRPKVSLLVEIEFEPLHATRPRVNHSKTRAY